MFHLVKFSKMNEPKFKNLRQLSRFLKGKLILKFVLKDESLGLYNLRNIDLSLSSYSGTPIVAFAKSFRGNVV